MYYTFSNGDIKFRNFFFMLDFALVTTAAQLAVVNVAERSRSIASHFEMELILTHISSL